MRRMYLAAGVAALALVVGAAAVTAKPRNGGFETGDLTGWKNPQGEWFVYSDMPPRGGAPPPPRGQFAAGIFQGGPGLDVLHRVLTLNRNRVNKLSLFLFWNNFAPGFRSPRHLNCSGPQPNQQFRIDILKPRAPLGSVRRRHVLFNLARSLTGTPQARGYHKRAVNLTRQGIHQRRVRLRIATCVTEAPLPMGVDHVKQTTGRRL